jgi:glycosyltransferase involved in cell wall biosynthesis
VPTVVFDVRANHDTGVSRYGLSLLAATAPLAAQAGWRLLCVAHPAQAERARNSTIGMNVGIASVHEPGFVRRSPWLRSFLLERSVDLYFTSHYTVDRYCPVPFAFTIHDLTRLKFPELSYSDESFAEQFGAEELALIRRELAHLSPSIQPQSGEMIFTRYFTSLNQWLVKRARRVISVSKSTQRDIQSLLNPEPESLALVPCGVDTAIFHRCPEAVVRDVRAAYGLTGPYLMFVGLTHPHKRWGWLVEQLVRARPLLPAGARLVAVGGHAERESEIYPLLERHRAQGFIVFTGRVSDETLASLYTGSSALVTASVNEGNSLPPLEALACGCPVIATDIPPLRETLGSAANFYDPTSGEELVQLVAAALKAHRPDQPHTFRPPSWPDAAQRLIGALEGAMASSRKEAS